ncbi:DEKNAAC100762 [Brettanomyces naardenensis]|uniref:DEKNAAC100762 n=1 Tax=Brettanomyces naardenensis TaxID=13370 RepID=A0A448YGH5_BRENA|nr:DEKNAAC100762 [Brettanomyces naardenensis]
MSSKTIYKCPFDYKTTIIQLPVDADTEKGEKRRFNWVKKDADETRFVKCQPDTIVDAKGDAEEAHEFYQVDSFWDFDNVGVSRHAKTEDGGIIHLANGQGTQTFKICRYLTCGECDKGAIGFGGYPIGDVDENHQNANDLSYFVSF